MPGSAPPLKPLTDVIDGGVAAHMRGRVCSPKIPRKNAEAEFPEVCVSPKGAYEPWMLFRKPIETNTVAENLRRWKTGALRRLSTDKPLPDAIPSGRTPKREEAISDHPCLKPQHFMRIIVRALLPLGEGTMLDPFMGSGATIAAAEAVGYASIGLEIDPAYFRLAEKAIPRLASLYPQFHGQQMEVELNGVVQPEESDAQMAMILAEPATPYGQTRAHVPIPKPQKKAVHQS